VVLTFECLILFKIMRFGYAWVLSEHLQHPVYVSKPMNHHYISNVKNSLQYCLKLSSNQSNPAYNSVFNSKFISVFEIGLPPFLLLNPGHPSLPFLLFPPLPFPPFPSLPLEVGPLNPARGLGCCKLPQRGVGRSPSQN